MRKVANEEALAFARELMQKTQELANQNLGPVWDLIPVTAQNKMRRVWALFPEFAQTGSQEKLIEIQGHISEFERMVSSSPEIEPEDKQQIAASTKPFIDFVYQGLGTIAKIHGLAISESPEAAAEQPAEMGRTINIEWPGTGEDPRSLDVRTGLQKLQAMMPKIKDEAIEPIQKLVTVFNDLMATKSHEDALRFIAAVQGIEGIVKPGPYESRKERWRVVLKTLLRDMVADMQRTETTPEELKQTTTISEEQESAYKAQRQQSEKESAQDREQKRLRALQRKYMVVEILKAVLPDPDQMEDMFFDQDSVATAYALQDVYSELEKEPMRVSSVVSALTKPELKKLPGIEGSLASYFRMLLELNDQELFNTFASKTGKSRADLAKAVGGRMTQEKEQRAEQMRETSKKVYEQMPEEQKKERTEKQMQSRSEFMRKAVVDILAGKLSERNIDEFQFDWQRKLFRKALGVAASIRNEEVPQSAKRGARWKMWRREWNKPKKDYGKIYDLYNEMRKAAGDESRIVQLTKLAASMDKIGHELVSIYDDTPDFLRPQLSNLCYLWARYKVSSANELKPDIRRSIRKIIQDGNLAEESFLSSYASPDDKLRMIRLLKEVNLEISSTEK